MKITPWLVHRRHFLLILSIGLALLLAGGIPRAGFDTSISALMTKSDPYLEELLRMQAEFPNPQEISFAFVPGNGEVFDLPTLQAIADLQREFRRIPLARTLSSILEWQSPYGEVMLFERPQQLDSYSRTELNERRDRALGDPLINGVLLSADADLALATVRLETQTLDRQQNRAVAEMSLQLRDELQARHPQVQIHVSSGALYEESTRNAMISDLTRLLPVVLLLCTLIICYSFRSLLTGICILVSALLSVIMTAGLLGWSGRSFNTISVMAPLVVVTIAVANSVHIISIFRQNLGAGLPRQQAMIQGLMFNMRPISLATLTTAIGFASLNLASSPAVSSFGSVVAIGVIFAWLLALLTLPALILLLPAASTPNAVHTPTAGLLRLCEWLVIQHGSRLLWAVAVLGAVTFAFSFRNQADFERMAFIDEDSPLHDYYLAVSEKMNRGPVLEYGVDTRQEYGVTDPQRLRQVDRLAAWLREQPEVFAAVSLVELVKTVNQVLNENHPEAYLIPDTATEVDQHLLNYQQVQRRDFMLDRFISDDFSMLRLFVTTRPLSNQQIIDFNSRLEAEFRITVPDATLLHGSSTLLFARMDRAVTVELLQGYAFSLLLITTVLVLGMRSLYHGLLTVLPNLLPATIVFGVWGLFVGQIDPFVMMLFSISIGLVVDDSVHMLSAVQSMRGRGHSPAEAVRLAMEKAGPALIITTAVMAVGTCVLIAASTLYFQQAATLLVPIVVLALLLDLTFFPALLLRFDRSSSRGSPAAA